MHKSTLIFKISDDSVNLILPGKEIHRSHTFLVTPEGYFSLSFSDKNKNFTRRYAGSLEIHCKKGSLVLVNITPLEPYIRAAARAELGPLLVSPKNLCCKPGWKQELLGAMEISIRSYIASFNDRHDSSLYQFCDLTHCIYFPGLQHLKKNETSSTAGIIMVDKEKNPVCAYFHSTSGGTLSGPEVFWPRHKKSPHYRRGNDSFRKGDLSLSRRSPHEKWHARISHKVLSRICRTTGIKSITPRYRQKRVTSLILVSDKNRQITMPIALFMSRAGRKLGWNVIKSNSFTVKKSGLSFIFAGHGLGHGIGLSQWSARELACRGFTAKEILSFYYNKPEFESWAQ